MVTVGVGCVLVQRKELSKGDDTSPSCSFFLQRVGGEVSRAKARRALSAAELVVCGVTKAGCYSFGPLLLLLSFLPPPPFRSFPSPSLPFPPSLSFPPGLSTLPAIPFMMWKLSKGGKVLLDDSPEEEESHRQDPPPPSAPAATFSAQNKDPSLHDEVTSSVSQLATKVQGAGFRGWKEVTSIFGKEDEQQLLTGCKSPKSKGTSSKLKEDVKLEKKTGFWDSLVTKQNIQSRKPDEIEGWEPPQIPADDNLSDVGNTLHDHPSWSGWEDETKGSTKYTNLASSGNSSRWSIRSAGRLVSIRRQSKSNLTDNWEELE
nr:testis development-related protein isoform X1 [Pogona vitticeps]